MQVLARFHPIGTRELDADIHPPNGIGEVKPGTYKGGPFGSFHHVRLWKRVLRLASAPRPQGR